MSVATNKAAKVQDHPLCLVALAGKRCSGMLQGGKLLLVALALALQFLGNLLLEYQSLQSIISLLLCTGQAKSETREVVLLLINKTGEAAVLPLVALDLDLELRSLLRELLGKGLEFEEL